jgi:hypothetical protein
VALFSIVFKNSRLTILFFVWCYSRAVPVLIIVSGDLGASVFVRSVIVWMNDLAVVTLIFGNLMYSVHMSSRARSSSSDEEKAKLGVAIQQYMSTSARNNQHQHSKVSHDVISHHGMVGVEPVPEEERQLQELIEDDDDDAPTASRNTPPAPLPQTSLNPRTRPTCISSISMLSGSQGVRNTSTRSVSFDENVTVSEIPSISSEREEQRTHGSEKRFAAEKLESAPLKPNRFPYDAALIRPARQPSYGTPLEKGALKNNESSSPNGRRHSIESSRQGLASDSLITIPLRQPSEVELPKEIDITDHSHQTKLDSGGGGKMNLDEGQEALSEARKVPPPFHGPPQLPSRGVSVFEITEAFRDAENHVEEVEPIPKPPETSIALDSDDQASQHQCAGELSGQNGVVQKY